MNATLLCSIEGCDKVAKTRGWCQKHYTRWRRHGNPEAYLFKRNACYIEGCNTPTESRGLCKMHAARRDRNGDPLVTKLIMPPARRLNLPTEEVVTKYLLGMSTIKLAKEYGCNAVSIQRLLKKAGVEIRKPKFTGKVATKNSALKGKFGIDLDGYATLLYSQQGGVCALCSLEAPSLEEMADSRFWPVDHDHSCCPGRKSCGQCLRGILCNKCNSAMSELWQDKEWRERALEYMNNCLPRP